MKKRKQFCVICGAKNRSRFQDTCDSICTRATYGSRSRGAQYELELRLDWARPILIDHLSRRDLAEEIEYNRPYMVDVLIDRRNN